MEYYLIEETAWIGLRAQLEQLVAKVGELSRYYHVNREVD